MYGGIETNIIACINNVLNYLRSGNVSSNVVGSNVFGDISKEFDIVAEDILANCIVNTLGDVMIVGEERGVRRYGSSRWIAVVDPVDGSSNFDAEIPWASISVAIAKNSNNIHPTLENVVFAAVAEIFRNRVYVYRNGDIEVIGDRISRRASPKPILLGYFETLDSYKPIESYMSLKGRVALRSLGSAALDVVYVGLGNAEGFIDMRSKLRNVDIAAALKIALAMGAKAQICDFSEATAIPIEDLIKIKCILVGYDETYLTKLIEAVQKLR